MKNSIAVFMIGVLIAALAISCGKGQEEQTATQQQAQSGQMMQHEGMQGMMQTESLAEDEAIDPVCGMKIKKADATHTFEYQGKTYYFCMENDYKAFVADPQKYLAQK